MYSYISRLWIFSLGPLVFLYHGHLCCFDFRYSDFECDWWGGGVESNKYALIFGTCALYEYKVRHELPSSTCIIQRGIKCIPLNDDVIIIIFALF
jgi:hypothetical protein